MRTTVLNTSKELSAFSDFPPPVTLPNFMRHNHYMDYIRSYVEHFKLLPHLNMEHEIVECRPEWTGGHQWDDIKWLVRVKKLKSGAVVEEKFDRLMVAVGHHNIPFKPSLAGQQKFKGEVLHSARLKDILANQKFVDKNVLVVGFGNSACDAANDIAMLANKCYVSCHRGQWFTSRFLVDGPYDFRIKSRLHHYTTKLLPASLIDGAIVRRLEQRTNHEMLGLRAKHKPSEQVPAINDLFPYRIYTGGIVLKSSIKSFTEHGVVFDGEDEQEYRVDIVVLATGYEAKISFLNELQLGLRSAEHNNEYDLFLNIFAPKLKLPPSQQLSSGKSLPLVQNGDQQNSSGGGDKKASSQQSLIPWNAIKTLAFIGLVQPNGSITVISELQARYAVLVFKGERELPSMKAMLKHMEQVRKMRSKAIRSHSRDQLVGSYVGYMETLAQLIGVRPNLTKLFFTDHKLWKQLLFGPCVPYQYRLTGPGSWPEARQVTLATKERVYCGINEGKNHILYKARRKCLQETKSKTVATPTSAQRTK